MEFIRQPNRIYAQDSSGAIVAEVTFPAIKEGEVQIDHTYVDAKLRGRGIAAILMNEAYESIKEQGFKAVPTCSYAAAWFENNPGKMDILS
ncbi:MAG: N-acetyltransferase [Clostridiales bacterium]|jgi:predicted GNAT family acetyltransferase|nr:N-acetyltransferase [Clostridiales bacterium]